MEYSSEHLADMSRPRLSQELEETKEQLKRKKCISTRKETTRELERLRKVQRWCTSQQHKDSFSGERQHQAEEEKGPSWRLWRAQSCPYNQWGEISSWPLSGEAQEQASSRRTGSDQCLLHWDQTQLWNWCHESQTASWDSSTSASEGSPAKKAPSTRTRGAEKHPSNQPWDVHCWAPGGEAEEQPSPRQTGQDQPRVWNWSQHCETAGWNPAAGAWDGSKVSLRHSVERLAYDYQLEGWEGQPPSQDDQGNQ